MEKVGIEELKELCTFAACVVSEGYDIMADGKIGIGDIGDMLSILRKAPAAFKGIGEIPKEVADLDEAEAAEILAHVKEKVDLDDKIIEAKFENIFAIAVNVAVVIGELVKSVSAEG